MMMMNTFGYNSNCTSLFHRNNDNDNSNHQSPSKKNPKEFPLSPRNLRRSIPMKTVLAQPLPIHSTPHRMKKKIRSQKPPSQRRRRTKKRLGEQVPIRTVYVQSLHTHCRGVVIVKSHTCLFSGVTPYIHTYNSTEIIPRNLPKRLLFYPPTAPYHPTPLGHSDVLSLFLSFFLSLLALHAVETLGMRRSTYMQ